MYVFVRAHNFVQNFEIQLQQAQKLTVRSQWNINQFQRVELTCVFIFIYPAWEFVAFLESMDLVSFISSGEN